MNSFIVMSPVYNFSGSTSHVRPAKKGPGARFSNASGTFRAVKAIFSLFFF